MRLTVTTPLAIVVDTEEVTSLRAEDETGAFGILPGHADFITALSVSVVSWSDARQTRHHLAVRGGMLQVREGQSIVIATREAVRGDDLRRLEADVVERFRREVVEERVAHSDAQMLYLAAIRQIYHALRPNERTPIPRLRSAEGLDGLEP